MNEPIKTGDDCIVIAGLGRQHSPNAGKRVRVVSVQGEHSVHGRIVRCEGEGIKQMTDSGAYVVTGWADFAVSWLRKADPLPPKVDSTNRELEQA